MAVCPYCDVDVSEQRIESEDGCCPECGAFITLSATDHLYGDVEDEFDDEYDDDIDFDDELDDDDY